MQSFRYFFSQSSCYLVVVVVVCWWWWLLWWWRWIQNRVLYYELVFSAESEYSNIYGLTIFLGWMNVIAESKSDVESTLVDECVYNSNSGLNFNFSIKFYIPTVHLNNFRYLLLFTNFRTYGHLRGQSKFLFGHSWLQ